MLAFFVACTEVKVYPAMKYFLKNDETFMNFGKKLAKVLINNSYINEKTCEST